MELHPALLRQRRQFGTVGWPQRVRCARVDAEHARHLAPCAAPPAVIASAQPALAGDRKMFAFGAPRATCRKSRRLNPVYVVRDPVSAPRNAPDAPLSATARSRAGLGGVVGQ